MYKILITKSAASPYRVDFYNELGKYVDLSILYDYKLAFGRHTDWSKKKAINYTEIYQKYCIKFRDKVISLDFMRVLNKDFDLIIIGEYSTIIGMLQIIYLKVLGIPFALNIDGGYIKKDNFLVYKIKKLFISSANWWFSPSVQSDKYLIHYGANQSNFCRYPFTSLNKEDCQTTILTKEEKKNKKAILNIKEEKIILSVGRFIKSKGFDILLKSIIDIDESYGVYIVGGKPTSEYLDIINEYKLKNIHFIDHITKEELSEYYLVSDVFVLPTKHDVWGLVINEAMAHGLPIITTNMCVAGNELVIDDENGYIVDVDNTKKIRLLIEKICSDKNISENMMKNNLIKIRSYTIQNMAKIHFDFIKVIIESRKKYNE